MNSIINDANKLLPESKSVEINVISIAILLAYKESIEEKLKNYDIQLNQWIDEDNEEKEENEKDIEYYGNVTGTGKKVMDKLKVWPSSYKKNCFIWLIDRPSKMMKKAVYFILRAPSFSRYSIFRPYFFVM